MTASLGSLASYLPQRNHGEPTPQSTHKTAERRVLAATDRDILYDPGVNNHRNSGSVPSEQQVCSSLWFCRLHCGGRPETLGLQELLKGDSPIVSECSSDVRISTLPQPDLQFWINDNDLNTFRRPSVAQQVVTDLLSYYGGGQLSPRTSCPA